MKTKEEIETYFTTKLNTQLDELEGQRLEILKIVSYKKYLPFVIAAAVLSLIVYLTIVKQTKDENKNLFTGLCFVFVIVTFLFTHRAIASKRNKLFEPCKLEYKSKVLGGIAAFLNNNLKVQPGSGLSRETFEHSRLFPKANSYESDILTEGTVFGLPIQMSNVNYYTVRESKDNKGKSKGSTATYFEGAYCIIKISTGMDNFVRINPKSAIRNKITGLMPDKNSNGLVKTLFSTFVGEVNDSVLVQSGNKEFDENFSLRAYDEKTVEKFVHSMWVQRLIDFKKNQEWELHVYLDKNELHLALGGFNMKELNVASPINECVFTQTYINYVNDLLALAQEISKNGEVTSKKE